MGGRMEEWTEEHRLEIENRIRNLFWTVSGDYTIEFEPEIEDYAGSKQTVLYEAVKLGAFARHFDQEKLERYLAKKLSLFAEEDLLLELTRLCIDAAVFPRLRKERPGAEEIRAQAFGKWLKEGKVISGRDILGQAKVRFMEQVLQESGGGMVREMSGEGKPDEEEPVKVVLDKISVLDHAENTDDVIAVIDNIYQDILDSASGTGNGRTGGKEKTSGQSLSQAAWQECMSDEEMEGVIQKFLSGLKKKMMSLEIVQDKKKHRYSAGKQEMEEPGETDPKAAARIREYVELHYGKSSLTPLKQERINRKFCNGIHKNCTLYLTDGILKNPVRKNNQYRFSQLQYEKNRKYYGGNHRIIKRNIADLADSLKKAFVLRNDEPVSRSTAGRLVPNRLWKIDRTEDEKLFDQKKKSEDSEFVVDVLLDASGSQAKRQSQVAAQGYILSEALSEAGIPHRVLGYCTFWGYTVLQRFRDYEEAREANMRIFEYRAYGNNRDGLVFKAVCASLLERPEENKILIILSDGKPCDLGIRQPGVRTPSVYDGEEAVRDTASEVCRARNQGISVIGIFAGEEEDLPAEKRIFGKDFAYIRNISNFSRMAGSFLRRQIEME